MTAPVATPMAVATRVQQALLAGKPIDRKDLTALTQYVAEHAENNRVPLQDRLIVEVRTGLRRQRMTQSMLAEQINVGQTHVSDMLKGRVSGSLQVWDRMLAAVGS